MTRKQKYSRIKHMKEIWNMWKLVRFFYNNRMVLASQACKDDSKDRFNKRISELVVEEFEKREPELPTKEEKDKAFEGIYNKVRTDMDEYADMFIEGGFYSYNKEARVNRNDLAKLFLQEQKIEPNIFKIEDELKKEESRIARIGYNSIVDSCIDDKNGYIKKCNDDKNKIYLSAEGKKFSGIDGLLKAEISELGVLRSFVLAVLGTLGVTNFDWIIKITAYVSPWW